MEIPYREIEPDTLTQLIEFYVLREGTDYGEVEKSLADKVQDVRRQLENGDAKVVYSELHESVNIVTRNEF
ncbi:YheU family protein [Aliidiomarina sp.]|jgi:uncharacterized protein YheU (UPF0270 family)|uniref:YheU family protein n=1 Tax=Aliidiomarina sp. TaxID=1872439 RepID=UPI003A4D77E6|nr:YheU family protein [Idiomarina sp.]